MKITLVLKIFIVFLAIKTAENCPAKPLNKIGLQAECYSGGVTLISCFDSIKVDTKAYISCKFGYESSRNIESQQITCQSNNQWSEEPMDCRDVCVDNTDAMAQAFVNNKIESTLAQVPWHVSILVNTLNLQIYNFNKLQCYGVILNAKIVLTSFACVRPFGAYEMTVIAGKFKRGTDTRELYAQTSGVKKVYVNHNFTNDGVSFLESTQVAILELDHAFDYNKFIRPACLDFPSISDEVFNKNPVGFTVQWDDFANCVFNLEFTYVELHLKEFTEIYKEDKCSDPNDPLKLFPYDIFCYKIFTVQREYCNPQPGTGIMLKKQLDDGTSKKYLWGLVLHSYLQPPTSVETMNIQTAIFMNIWHQRDFIMGFMERYKSSNVLSYQYTNKACPTINFESKHLDAKCEFDYSPTACSDYIKPGTTVRIQCKQDYQKPNFNRPDEIKCMEEGIWSDDFYHCEQICGKVEKYTNDQGLVPLIYGGEKTDVVNVPWQVVIYANNTSQDRGKWALICGGTLTHPNIVISAAHCFWNPSRNEAFPPFSYLVASGKRYRDYDTVESHAQYSRIMEISIPTTFNTISLRSDIAVLVLEKTFKFNAHTKPACLNWSSYGNYDYKAGILGLLAGWGSTSQYSGTSSDLRLVKIPTVDAASCRQLVDPEYKDFISGEKFCAQGSKGETACAGDSGGGFLVPKNDENGIERYYLIGVVSSGLNPAKHCTENFVSTYTNVQYHQDIIKVTAQNNTISQSRG